MNKKLKKIHNCLKINLKIILTLNYFYYIYNNFNLI